MSEHHNVDPVVLLGSLAPPAGWNERTDIATNATAASILARVIGDAAVSLRRPRRHLRIVTGIVVTVAVGGAAVAALWERSPEFAGTVSCWSEAVSPPAVQVAVDWDGLGDPVEACGAAWSGGDLGPRSQPEPSAACITNDGLTAVVPGDHSMCDALGLARFSPLTVGDEALAVAQVVEVLAERDRRGGCREVAEVAAEAREALDRVGLDDWTVDISDNFSDDSPCASVGFDESADRVVVVGTPRDDGVATGSASALSELARSTINEAFNGTTCVERDGARTAVRNELDQLGLHDWTITLADASSVDGPCARVELDPTSTTANVMFSGLVD